MSIPNLGSKIYMKMGVLLVLEELSPGGAR